MELRIAFLHGLESPHISDKTELLNKEFSFVYAPQMDYHDPSLFEKTLKEIQENKIDLIIGSSMGGWFAYCISTHTNIPTLLFNPAFHSRSFDPVVNTGDRCPHQTIVLGINDDVIKEADTVDYLHNNNIGGLVFFETIGHRTPIDIFEKYVNKIVNNFVK
jgi:predicted esterase YcpF (UPF0227 family)